MGQFAHSLAISSTGFVALGRVGGLDVFTLDGGREPRRFDCTDLVALARRADLVLSYESQTSGDGLGAIVVRRFGDGSTVAMYDVADVSALAVAAASRY
jgi:hypothetical protein